MVDKILKDIGIRYKECQFRKAPPLPYAVWHDSYAAGGADALNNIINHDITIELYSDTPRTDIEAAIENKMNEMSIKFTKQERYWIESEQLYQTIYEFSFLEKKYEEE